MKSLLKKGRSSVLILTVYVSSFFLFSACTEEKAEPFSFAVVSDTHYKHSISETFVRPFAEEIQTTYPEVCFVAHVGDFAQDYKPSGPSYYEANLKKIKDVHCKEKECERREAKVADQAADLAKELEALKIALAAASSGSGEKDSDDVIVGYMSEDS